MKDTNIEIKSPIKIQTDWGYELHITKDKNYSGRLMTFTNASDKTPMWMHMVKIETLYVQTGIFRLEWIDTKLGIRRYTQLNENDTVDISAGTPYQLISLVPHSTVYSFSENNYENDTYIIYKNMYVDLQSIEAHKNE